MPYMLGGWAGVEHWQMANNRWIQQESNSANHFSTASKLEEILGAQKCATLLVISLKVQEIYQDDCSRATRDIAQDSATLGTYNFDTSFTTFIYNLFAKGTMSFGEGTSVLEDWYRPVETGCNQIISNEPMCGPQEPLATISSDPATRAEIRTYAPGDDSASSPRKRLYGETTLSRLPYQNRMRKPRKWAAHRAERHAGMDARRRRMRDEEETDARMDARRRRMRDEEEMDARMDASKMTRQQQRPIMTTPPPPPPPPPSSSPSPSTTHPRSLCILGSPCAIARGPPTGINDAASGGVNRFQPIATSRDH
ncbi:hypothetical protein BDZ89DRAFT_1049125 [Hymenopellis radicata]|nr:hypothetical protein BDZ89DRAFT_1049125 [Hymenopellis radicata]